MSSTDLLLRLVGVGKVADVSAPISLGADFAAYLPAMATFDARIAESATARFPWIAAGIPRKAADLAKQPFVAFTGGTGRAGRPVPAHPVLAILETPNSAEPGSLFWRQIHEELYRTGSAYALKVRRGRRWTGLLWVPSARMLPIPGPAGYPTAYQNPLTGTYYATEDVIHWRFPGSSDGPEMTAGTGYIEPLKQTLDAEYALKARLAQASKQGRPTAIATPGDELGVMGGEQVKAIREELGVVFRQASGGIVVIGRKLDVEQLDWKPVDLDADEQLTRGREEQLAVMGVPPVRVGLETANYATAHQQEEVYWGDELEGDSALIDDVITMHARREFGPPDLYVYRDFSAVPALQGRRDAAVDRASKHIVNGMEPAEAYRVEGIDVPASAFPVPEPVTVPSPAPANTTPVEEPARLFESDGSFRRPVLLSREAPDRAARWAAWLSRAHTPTEVAIRRPVAAGLREQRDLVVANLESAYAGADRMARNWIVDLVEQLLPDDDAAAAMADVESRLRAALQRGVEEGIAQVSVSPVIDADRLDQLTDQQLATMVRYTTATTRAEIRAILTQGLAEGASVSDLQRLIQRATCFGPARSLAIARSETTRGLGAGTAEALRWALDAGAGIDAAWLSARDRHVRDAHALLDGQQVPVGSPFIIPGGEYAGESARYPGDFRLAALVVNCRCGLVAVER